MRDGDEVNFERIGRELRNPVDIGASLDARVMAKVRSLPRHARRGFWSRLTTPRTVKVSPLAWAALAASVVVVVGIATVGTYRGLAGDDTAPRSGSIFRSARTDTAAPQRIQFVLVAPTARKVAVVGDFNGWDPAHAAYQAMHRGGGVWSVTAQVPAGHHQYSFVVDDSLWMADPTAPRVVDSDFGMPKSAIVVGGGSQ